jgi:hypothetical protein
MSRYRVRLADGVTQREGKSPNGGSGTSTSRSPPPVRDEDALHHGNGVVTVMTGGSNDEKDCRDDLRIT